MGMHCVFLWRKSPNSDRRVEQPGCPCIKPDTWQDWEWWAEAWSYILYAQGYRNTDRVFLPFGYNIFVPSGQVTMPQKRSAARWFQGVCSIQRLGFSRSRNFEPPAMMATPTYILGMADTAKKKLGIDPAKDLTIRKITCAGEPGASIPSTKQRMEEAWGAKVYDHVGATEIGAWVTNVRPSPEASMSMRRSSLPNWRMWRRGDYRGAWSKGKGCYYGPRPYGSTLYSFRFQRCGGMVKRSVSLRKNVPSDQGRNRRKADDITKIKGVLLAPTAIEEVVRSIPGLAMNRSGGHQKGRSR